MRSGGEGTEHFHRLVGLLPFHIAPAAMVARIENHGMRS